MKTAICFYKCLSSLFSFLLRPLKGLSKQCSSAKVSKSWLDLGSYWSENYFVWRDAWLFLGNLISLKVYCKGPFKGCITGLAIDPNLEPKENKLSTIRVWAGATKKTQSFACDTHVCLCRGLPTYNHAHHQCMYDVRFQLFSFLLWLRSASRHDCLIR